jgi:hypothetical protein
MYPTVILNRVFTTYASLISFISATQQIRALLCKFHYRGRDLTEKRYEFIFLIFLLFLDLSKTFNIALVIIRKCYMKKPKFCTFRNSGKLLWSMKNVNICAFYKDSIYTVSVSSVLCDITPSTLVKVNRCFKGIACFLFHTDSLLG